MRRKTRHSARLLRVQHQMNVVPYIDVMLVLLIIFMITTPLFTPGVISLPSVGQTAQLTQLPIAINIDLYGNYTITQDQKTIAVSSLTILVREIAQRASSGSPIVIAADKKVAYEKVITVVDKLYNAGVKKVALVVKQKNA